MGRTFSGEEDAGRLSVTFRENDMFRSQRWYAANDPMIATDCWEWVMEGKIPDVRIQGQPSDNTDLLVD